MPFTFTLLHLQEKMVLFLCYIEIVRSRIIFKHAALNDNHTGLFIWTKAECPPGHRTTFCLSKTPSAPKTSAKSSGEVGEKHLQPHLQTMFAFLGKKEKSYQMKCQLCMP